MAQSHIPPVTFDDLLDFQAKHFPQDLLYRTSVKPPRPPVDGFADDEDDYLGYYENGVKRTLTDKQIEIFRHSEIHTLLRERQMTREDSDERSQESLSSKPLQSSEPPAKRVSAISSSLSHDTAKQTNVMKRKAPLVDMYDSACTVQKHKRNRIDKTTSHDEIFEHVQYDELGKPVKPARRVDSSVHPSFAGRRIISYDD